MSEDERSAIVTAADADDRPFSASDAMVTAATKPEFGDYQCNSAMSLARSTGLAPRECDQMIVDALELKLERIMELPLEIAGPGFVNLRFWEEYLSGALEEMVADSAGRMAVPVTE